ncbi:Hpt domain-containing protein [Pseudoalteromonas sp. MMG013]|uniref:Hpt domain-containing protein n=1 Tax=Pseudoalteromonas sp. MMG013 TaxID=2822687 RepID=UPI001B368F50|nr:Hpt domain-containing protein [Pseudoalteromonas sp. MMG013]MBQ4860115.1 Hpt domain-containing protein [Pseudoalteromonas sp. MMG013]
MKEREVGELQTINQQVMMDLIGNDRNEIIRFQQQFLLQAKQSLQHIATFYRTEQLAKIKEEAHFLKTSAKAVGAEICAHHLQTLEDSSQEQDKATCKLHIQSLSEELKRVYHYITPNA